MFLPNVENKLPSDVVSFLRRRAFSTTQPWRPRDRQKNTIFVSKTSICLLFRKNLYFFCNYVSNLSFTSQLLLCDSLIELLLLIANILHSGHRHLQAIRIQALSTSRQFFKLYPCKLNKTNSLEYHFSGKAIRFGKVAKEFASSHAQVSELLEVKLGTNSRVNFNFH